MIVIELIVMRMAVRPPPVALIVDVLVRMAVSLPRAGLALLEDHLGLTASANAAHRAISVFRTFNSPPHAIRAEPSPLALRPII